MTRSTTELEAAVAGHYRVSNLAQSIYDALKLSGADIDNLTTQQLSPVDEFHTAGRLTTERALAKMHLAPGMRVLDAGCGIGGAARYMAETFGVTVDGLDLTPEFINVARDLTERTHLTGKCKFHVGSVLAMPFPAEAFDAAITFHIAMNIADRDRFYAEAARVLKPRAQFCIFDVMKGPAPGMLYPVPWAETEATSILKSREETINLLNAAGFGIDEEENLREFAVQYFKDAFAKQAAGQKNRLGLQLLTGATSPQKFQNYLRAAEAGQVEPIILIARKR